MDANAIGQVVEKIAEKAGAAVDAARPIAEQSVREFAEMSAWSAEFYFMMAGVAAAVFVLSMLAIVWGAKIVVNANDAGFWLVAAGVMIGVLGLAVGLGSLLTGVHHTRRAKAPTYHCVKTLLGR